MIKACFSVITHRSSFRPLGILFVKIVIAPDSFKESLSAAQVAAAIALGVKDACRTAHIHCIPMADGGEGTVANVVSATGGQWRHTSGCKER
jgi:glycerate kinase